MLESGLKWRTGQQTAKTKMDKRAAIFENSQVQHRKTAYNDS